MNSKWKILFCHDCKEPIVPDQATYPFGELEPYCDDCIDELFLNSEEIQYEIEIISATWAATTKA